MSKDYYKTLKVEKTATKDEIKRAFRKAAHTHHPDKGGDEEKFKEVNEAYQVLSDEQKRAKYDQFGSNFDQPGAGGAGGFGGFSGAGMNFEDLGDIFGDMFGGSRGGRRQQKGSDIMVDVQLNFKDSVFGAEKEVVLSKNSTCERCAGTGGEPGTKMDTCGSCSGQGMRIGMRRTILGNVQTRVACEPCHGTGEVPEKKCTTCDGIGLSYGRRVLNVNIPAGIEDGMKIRVRGQGEAIGGTGIPGDLYLRVHVKNDPRFQREGSTIYTERKIGFTQAALGDTVMVETVDGKVKLKIPTGTQSGDKLRMRGKGVQTSRGRGDQIVFVQIVTPKKLNKKQKQALEELDLKE